MVERVLRDRTHNPSCIVMDGGQTFVRHRRIAFANEDDTWWSGTKIEGVPIGTLRSSMNLITLFTSVKTLMRIRPM
jgi:hypothetical protein